jgi:hypothetical protein
MSNSGCGGIAPTFLTLILDGGEWSDLHPTHFTPQGMGLQYPLDRRLSGPQRQPRIPELDLWNPVLLNSLNFCIANAILISCYHET